MLTKEGAVKRRDELEKLASLASYGGNPAHKRNPGDFGLQPPCSPRQDKTLCDEVELFSRREATRLLREAFSRGLVSQQWRQGWPQNVWAVMESGRVLEGMLENPTQGIYHGYPLRIHDPQCDMVKQRWDEYGV
ncbi:MAG: hypothetical protein KQJ78_24230 [Deltaproteobacteria bacterium]|nr:hypothetical protein [Deltaproteobacteria bacterium]